MPSQPTGMPKKIPVTINDVLSKGRVHAVISTSDGAHLGIVSDRYVDYMEFGHFAKHVYELYESYLLGKGRTNVANING